MKKMSPRTIGIIQARLNASRLPGKVLKDIAGEPMLVRVFERTSQSTSLDGVLVATTIDPSDDAIQTLCYQRGYPCFRGDIFDVLDRYYRAASDIQAEIIVRITADCPVIDPVVIDRTVNSFLGFDNKGIPITEQYDFAANRLPPPWSRTYPIGLDTEVVSYQNLELAWRQADQKHQREHVMPFFYEQPDRFRICHVKYKHDYGWLRWTVDTPADLELLRMIYARFPDRDNFSWLEIIDLYRKEPELFQINAEVKAKDYRQVDHRQT
jgi:spore coat polysaccharide biosynthesis protein SpsF